MTTRCTSRRIFPALTPEDEMGRIYAPGEALAVAPECVEIRCVDDEGHRGRLHVGFVAGRRVEWSSREEVSP